MKKIVTYLGNNKFKNHNKDGEIETFYSAVF